VRLQSVEEYVYNDLDMISEIWYNENGTKLVPYTYDAWGNATVTGDTYDAILRNPFRKRVATIPKFPIIWVVNMYLNHC
jgi:hypothetical protein